MKLPADHNEALDVICHGDRKLEKMRADVLASIAKRYPGLGTDHHTAILRACFEQWWQEGINDERERTKALAKFDTRATHSIVVDALAKGKRVSDIADQCFAIIAQGGAQNREYIPRPDPVKVETLSRAAAAKRISAKR